ncbi:MAG: phosphodiesterase [Flavobacteriales bacterium]|nr:phosphodiesterase [Flavobacteriales bacterium]
MKIAFISDIHGSKYWAEKAFACANAWGADKIAVLGDVMYHGPRNPLPEGYDPMGVAALLNENKDKIIAVRGNCDSEVDQMQVKYPMMADSTQIVLPQRTFFLTHGHVFSPENHPEMPVGTVFVFGHIHLPVAEKKGEMVYFNPSSVSLPHGGFPNSWGRYEDGRLEIVDMDGNVIKSLEL